MDRPINVELDEYYKQIIENCDKELTVEHKRKRGRGRPKSEKPRND
jgi:hypothetical protein